jgi:predicted nucleotidyltransferase
MTFDPEPYAAHFREANEAEAARVEAARVARIISDSDAAVRRVILFGSLAKGMPRSEGFDIDLADLRLVPEHVRDRILDEGIVLS